MKGNAAAHTKALGEPRLQTFLLAERVCGCQTMIRMKQQGQGTCTLAQPPTAGSHRSTALGLGWQY